MIRTKKLASLKTIVVLVLGSFIFFAFVQPNNPSPLHPQFTFTKDSLLTQIQAAGDPTLELVKKDPVRFLNLLDQVLQQERELFRLVDKRHSLPAEYVPRDLVPLDRFGVRTSRANLVLRAPAAEALGEMAEAARKDGIELLASSTYRSFQHQRTVNKRIVSQIGQEAADRVSARPGHSQHQLGTAIDFGCISDAFTATPMAQWLSRRGWEFGFSLSYPDSHEHITGYRFESWHYRYIGKEAVLLEREFFQGSQQKLLEFLHTHWDILKQAHRSS